MEEKLLPAEEQGAGKNLPFLTKRDLNNRPVGFSFPAFDPARLKGRYTFSPQEKLKSKKIIDLLFNEGKAVSQSGFTLVYLATPLYVPYPAQAGFSVPKKFFKHAVDRNRIKRLMREAYRHTKTGLYESLVAQQKQIALMCIYKGRELPDMQTTRKAIETCINRITK